MFERFTDKSRRAVVLCQEEARRYNHHCIGTEHILLALADDDTTVANLALTRLGADFNEMRTHVIARVGEGGSPAMGHIPFTVDAKRALEAAMREANDQGVDHVAPEHLLLGMLRIGSNVGHGVLVSAGITYESARAQVTQITGAPFPGQPLALFKAEGRVYPTREQAEAAGGDVTEVRVELRAGEAFAVANTETGIVLTTYHLDFPVIFNVAHQDPSAPHEVVVMRPASRAVHATGTGGRLVRIGTSTEYVAVPLKERTFPA